jgi:two-component system cell cycle sensor histidine kinase/response regulator CckA
LIISQKHEARRILAEEMVDQKSEETYRNLFDQFADGIYLHDFEGNIVDVNRIAVLQSGYSKEELLRMSVFDLHPGISDNADMLRQWTGWPVARRFTIEAEHRRKDGSVYPVEISRGKVKIEDRALILAIVQDTTERKQAEAERERLQGQLTNALELARLGHWEYDVTKDLFTFNDYFYKIFHTTAEQVGSYTMSSAEYASRFVHPDDISVVGEEIRKAIETADPNFSRKLEHLILYDDHTVGYISVRFFIVKDANGHTIKTYGVNQDITERKQAEEERQKLQAQLLQAQKMESVGRLAGGVAHDFNNMLGIIIGNAEMAALEIAPGHPLIQNIQEIIHAGRRSAETVRQLLAYARKQTIRPEVLDLNDTISGMLNMLRRIIGEDIELTWIPGKEVDKVRMDPSQINQVLANLVVNSRDAIPGVGKITIESANTVLDETYCGQHSGFVPGEYVLVVVSDTGVGMSTEVMEHIFDPFFTTKEMGRGTGLGLATVYGIVKQNEGFISVYSEPGKSTTFKIYLPRVGGERVSAQAKTEERRLPRGMETVLLAEDEGPLLRIARDILARQGYAVLAARTPGEALALAENHTGKIHLLLTDVVMPEMNGRELMESLHARLPSMKVLFMSGYTADVVAHHGVLDSGVHFIEKPFSPSALAEKVREVLDKG